MLKDVAELYYAKGYNCAESLIHAGNDYYNLGLSEHDMRMTAAFGAGLQIGDVCGALNASACIISARYVEVKAHDQPVELRTLTQRLVIAFQKRMGSRVCAKIKPVFHTPELRCLNTVKTAADVLEEVINEWDQEHPDSAICSQ